MNGIEVGNGNTGEGYKIIKNNNIGSNKDHISSSGR